MENKWEYDYDRAAQGEGTAPAQPTQNNTAEPQSSYPNVGSTGMNTANTASTFDDGAAPGPAAGAGGSGGNGGNGGNGHRPYDYAADYRGGGQPPRARREPRPAGGARKWVQRGVAAVLVAAIGFGGGYCGAMVAGGGGTKVVTQTVERTTPTDASLSAGSTATAMSTTEVANLVAPSVVVITTEEMVTSNAWFGGQYVQSGAGSGVIMSSDGYIITCNHVVSGASSIVVTLDDDSEYTATIVGADSQSDIAVIKIDATGLTPAVMGDSDTLAVGETVLAVGNPMGTLGGTVTDGIVSALNREITVENNQMTLIQTNASVSPGNSGGALFNMNGELIGIVNAKSSSSYAEGLGFAIPINTAYQVAQDLIESGYVTGRPRLGITVLTVSDAATAAQYGLSSTGVYISEVVAGSGAEAAGLRSGDRIVSVGDTLVETSSDVTNLVQQLSVGDTVTLQIARDGRLMTVDVTLTEASQQS